jgi:hypothetical protein
MRVLHYLPGRAAGNLSRQLHAEARALIFVSRGSSSIKHRRTEGIRLTHDVLSHGSVQDGARSHRFHLPVADTEVDPPVTHQTTQVTDAQFGYFVHPNQKRCADGLLPVSNFADNRSTHSKEPSQVGVVFNPKHIN